MADHLMVVQRLVTYPDRRLALDSFNNFAVVLVQFAVWRLQHCGKDSLYSSGLLMLAQLSLNPGERPLKKVNGMTVAAVGTVVMFLHRFSHRNTTWRLY